MKTIQRQEVDRLALSACAQGSFWEYFLDGVCSPCEDDLEHELALALRQGAEIDSPLLLKALSNNPHATGSLSLSVCSRLGRLGCEQRAVEMLRMLSDYGSNLSCQPLDPWEAFLKSLSRLYSSVSLVRVAQELLRLGADPLRTLDQKGWDWMENKIRCAGQEELCGFVMQEVATRMMRRDLDRATGECMGLPSSRARL